MTGQRPYFAFGNPQISIFIVLFPWGPFIISRRGSLILLGDCSKGKGGRVRRQETGIQGAEDRINHSTFQMGCVTGILGKETGNKKGEMA